MISGLMKNYFFMIVTKCLYNFKQNDNFDKVNGHNYRVNIHR